MVTVKLSILLQYITIFVTHRGTAFYYAVHCLIWINVIYYTILLLLDLIQVSDITISQRWPISESKTICLWQTV